MDMGAVESTVEDVVAALWATDPMDHLIVRQGWPGASCENVSAAIAVVLEDRGLGTWTYVRASRPGERNSHAWLEWEDEKGAALFSIDRTLEQFPEWRGPYIGAGASPAASVFTEDLWKGRVWDLDWIELDIGHRLIHAVREQLSRST